MKPCSRCGLLFTAFHGNQLYCATCRQKRSFRPRSASTPALGVRTCAFCRMPYQARAENQLYCSKRCKDRAKPAAMSAKYAHPSHRLGRKASARAVASGFVRCARGRACKWAELVDGELVGGFIRGPWDLATRMARASEVPSTASAIGRRRGGGDELRPGRERTGSSWP